MARSARLPGPLLACARAARLTEVEALDIFADQPQE